MLDNLKGSHLVASWGVTVALGWIATIAMAVMQMSVMKVMLAWTVLMAVPVLMTVKLYMDGDSNKLFNFWAVIVTVLMVENFVTPASVAVYSYFLLWIIAGAVGFYYTSTKLPPPSDKIYRYGAIASAIAVPVVFHNFRTGAILGLITQAVPMLYDYQKVHR